MKEKTALVVDDDSTWAESMRKRVLSATRESVVQLKPVSLAGNDLKREIGGLLSRQQDIRQHPSKTPAFGSSLFDDADITIIDYDLAGLFGTEALMTGELLASLVRKYSTSGPILSVNRFGPRRFSLLPQGQSRGWADLSVSHQDLGDPGLWTHKWNEYRPWSWPVFSELPTKFRERVEYCIENYEKRIVDLLGIPPSVAKAFPRRASDALGDPAKVTVKQLVRSRLSPKERALPKVLAARYAASEIGRWLEDVVLPGQEILIDSPHLGSHFPSLLRLDRLTRNELNKLADLHADARLPIRGELISEAEFKVRLFLSRRAWWTDLVLSNQSLKEVSEPWERRAVKYVFAEDTSRFEDPENCIGFRSEGLSSTRWVRRPDPSIPYDPPSRLAA